MGKLPPAGEVETANTANVLRSPNDVAARAQLRSAEGDVNNIVNALIKALTNADPYAGLGGEVFYADDEELELSSESDDELEVLAFDPTTNVPPPGKFFTKASSTHFFRCLISFVS